MIYSILASIMLVTAITLFLDLTPERVTDDILRIISPKDSMRERAKNLRGNRKKHKLYSTLIKFKSALAATGKSKQFTAVCFASVFLFGAGNIPNFAASELTSKGYEKYSNLDSSGRTQFAIASVGKDTMPKEDEERGSISSIKPSGWIQAKYTNVSGGWLYNR